MRVLITLLALCCVAAAETLNANCSDAAAMQYEVANLASCDPNNATNYCTGSCAGSYCEFYTNNSYTADCATSIAFGCFAQGQSVPTNCERCFDSSTQNFTLDLPPSCGFNGSGNETTFCTNSCFGQTCEFYANSSYPSDCRGWLEQVCLKTNNSVPSDCATPPSSSPSPTLPEPTTPAPIPPAFARCFDAAYVTYMRSTLPNCADSTADNYCTDGCGGSICSYYASNDYPTQCSSLVAGLCYNQFKEPPKMCTTCFNIGVAQAVFGLPPKCDLLRAPLEQICSDDCYGAVCSYYDENEFPDPCRADAVKVCEGANLEAPAECVITAGGHIATATTTNVLVVLMISLILQFV